MHTLQPALYRLQELNIFYEVEARYYESGIIFGEYQTKKTTTTYCSKNKLKYNILIVCFAWKYEWFDRELKLEILYVNKKWIWIYYTIFSSNMLQYSLFLMYTVDLQMIHVSTVGIFMTRTSGTGDGLSMLNKNVQQQIKCSSFHVSLFTASKEMLSMTPIILLVNLNDLTGILTDLILHWPPYTLITQKQSIKAFFLFNIYFLYILLFKIKKQAVIKLFL